MKEIIQNIFKLTKKMEAKIEKEEEESEYEDYEEDEVDLQPKDENKMKEIVSNIIMGEPNDNNKNKDNDEDIDEEDLDDDDIPLTDFEKKSAIICVKDTMNEIGKNAEINKIIIESVGDKLNELNDIFNKEEERRKNQK